MLYGSSLFKLLISFTENPRISKHVLKDIVKQAKISVVDIKATIL